MPIRFRCGYCNRLLGIARRKAGTETTCPHCGYTLTVPEASDNVPDISGMEEFDELLNPMPASEPRSRSPSPQSSPAATYPSAGTSAPAGDRPLFERNLDAVMPASSATADPRLGAKGRPAPTSGLDAMSLGEQPGQIVLSVRKVTVLAIVVVILIGVSFAAGFLVAANK